LAKFGIGVALVALTTIAYFTIFYSDIASSIKSAETKEQNLKRDLRDADDVERAYQQDLSELNTLQLRERELNKVLPDNAAAPAFLSALQGVANSSGVSLLAWSPMEEARQEYYAKIPMQLKLVGRFHQIAKFFYGVGQLDRIINIEDVEIGKPKAVDDDVTVEVDCLATAFRSLSASEKAADPKGKPKATAGRKTR